MTKKILVILSIINHVFWQAAGLFLAAFYLVYRLLIPKKQGSHPVSRFFRRIFEQKQARNRWGTTLLLFILIAHFCFRPFSSVPQFGNQVVLAAPENVFTTESTYQQPVQGWLSQGFHWHHKAIDISANLGENIYPIGIGKVILVKYTNWGYGHFIVIDHGNEYKSLYAHLAGVQVETGQEVDKNTLLGYIGMTGYTSGPHLHLEIYNQEGNINPLDVLPGVLPQLTANN